MMKNENFNKDENAGYSLIELIVVISIMAVMVGLASVGISLMFSKDAEYAAKVIDDELSETRMLSMSRDGTFVMYLDIDNNSIEIKRIIGATTESYKTIDINRSATYVVAYGGTSKSSGTVSFEFDKANGSVKKVGGAGFTSGVCTITSTSTKLSSKQATVDLIAATGRHYVRK